MRTIALASAVAADLAPLAFGEFQLTPLGDGVEFLASWTKTLPECQCTIAVQPANFLITATDPDEFRPVGPWSYSGNFDYTGWSANHDHTRWTGPDSDGFHIPHAAYARAFQDHQALCWEWREAMAQCVHCQVIRRDHAGPSRSVFACDDFARSC